MEFRKDEAYGVCESARDSTVFQSPEHNFTIHIAWSGQYLTVSPILSLHKSPVYWILTLLFFFFFPSLRHPD